MDYKPNISAFTIIVSFFCLALVGLALVPLLPVRLSPSRELPQLSVSFQMYGNSARPREMVMGKSRWSWIAMPILT